MDNVLTDNEQKSIYFILWANNFTTAEIIRKVKLWYNININKNKIEYMRQIFLNRHSYSQINKWWTHFSILSDKDYIRGSKKLAERGKIQKEILRRKGKIIYPYHRS